MGGKADNRYVRALARGIEVFNTLQDEFEAGDVFGLTITELSRKTGFDRAVLDRMLNTLEEYGLVRRHPRLHNRWVVGMKLVPIRRPDGSPIRGMRAQSWASPRSY